MFKFFFSLLDSSSSGNKVVLEPGCSAHMRINRRSSFKLDGFSSSFWHLISRMCMRSTDFELSLPSDSDTKLRRAWRIQFGSADWKKLSYWRSAVAVGWTSSSEGRLSAESFNFPSTWILQFFLLPFWDWKRHWIFFICTNNLHYIYLIEMLQLSSLLSSSHPSRRYHIFNKTL